VSDKYEEIHNKFLRVEDEMGLFSLEIDGILVWERIRHKVHRKILRKSGLIGEAHTGSSLFQSGVLRKYPLFVYRWVKSLLFKNAFLTGQRDFLFCGSGRRKKRDGGHWWDIYCDPITEELDLDYVLVENRYQDIHQKPAKTDEIRYLDFIEDTGVTCKKLGLDEVSFSSQEEQRMQEITGTFETEFEVPIGLKDMIELYLTERRSTKWMYDRLVKRVDPKVAVVVCSYGNKVLVEACKDSDVPVVELQHGIIHEHHMAYHFPDDVEVPTFPDYFLTFGKYWCDCINFPIDDSRVIPAGYPYLEMESKKYADVEERDQIIFISQGTVGEELSRFAVELSECADGYDIIYKLHPGEYDRWGNDYPWLNGSDLRVVDSDEPPLYQLFAESRAQVGVGSTAVYEGLKFDLDTYVVDLPDKHKLKHLIEEGYVEVVKSPEELLKCLETDSYLSFDAELFFKRCSVNNIIDSLNRIRAEHR